MLDALLDAGADIDAPGAVIAGGTPLSDATAFAQWHAARRLVERGAAVDGFAAATLGLMDHLERFYGGAEEGAEAGAERLDDAFWAACHGGQVAAASYLLDRGAHLDHLPGWEQLTPLDAAARSGAHAMLTWLHERGARTSSDLRGV